MILKGSYGGSDAEQVFMFYWFMLALSIASEIVGTVSLKYFAGQSGIGAYLFLFCMVGASYFFLAKAIQGLPLSLAYAVWEGVGLITVVLLGYLFFGEALRLDKLWACALVLGGIVLLKIGQKSADAKGGKADGNVIPGFGGFLRRCGEYCPKIF